MKKELDKFLEDIDKEAELNWLRKGSDANHSVKPSAFIKDSRKLEILIRGLSEHFEVEVDEKEDTFEFVKKTL